jgi:hypothetical protein
MVFYDLYSRRFRFCDNEILDTKSWALEYLDASQAPNINSGSLMLTLLALKPVRCLLLGAS